jgi:hypothetical protein
MKYGELVKVSKIMDIGAILDQNDTPSLKDQLETSILNFDQIIKKNQINPIRK